MNHTVRRYAPSETRTRFWMILGSVAAALVVAVLLVVRYYNAQNAKAEREREARKQANDDFAKALDADLRRSKAESELRAIKEREAELVRDTDKIIHDVNARNEQEKSDP